MHGTHSKASDSNKAFEHTFTIRIEIIVQFKICNRKLEKKSVDNVIKSRENRFSLTESFGAQVKYKTKDDIKYLTNPTQIYFWQLLDISQLNIIIQLKRQFFSLIAISLRTLSIQNSVPSNPDLKKKIKRKSRVLSCWRLLFVVLCGTNCVRNDGRLINAMPTN